MKPGPLGRRQRRFAVEIPVAHPRVDQMAFKATVIPGYESLRTEETATLPPPAATLVLGMQWHQAFRLLLAGELHPSTSDNQQPASLATKVLNVQALSPWPPGKFLQHIYKTMAR